MSEFRSIEFTQIADEWNSITLGETQPEALLVMRNGLTAKQVQNSSDYKVTRIETIGDGWIDETRVRFVSGLKDRDIEKYLIRKGDILFSHINSDKHLGKTGLAMRNYNDLLHGMNLLLIRANPKILDPEFLNRVFQYYRDIGVFISICSRAVNQSSINQAKMKALEIPLPPLHEQRKIAHILSTVQHAIEVQERLIQTTTELKKALMHKLFTEGLCSEPQQLTEIGPVPESWVVAKIGAIAKIRSGGTPSRKNPAFWDGGDINWIKTGEINYCKIVRTEEKITKAGLEASSAKLFPKGTLLVAMYGQGVTRGKVAITGIEAATNQACVAIFPMGEVRTRYLYYFLEYKYDTIRNFAHGANQKNLSADLIKSFPLAYPGKVKEQNEIADTLGITDRKISVARSKKSQLQVLFRTLLHELMTAKARIQDLEFSKQEVI